MTTCKICMNSRSNKSYIAREMMFGYRDPFTYFQCSKCGCLQISKIPSDMSKYYPRDYYSFSLNSHEQSKKTIKRLFITMRNHYAVFNKGIIGKLFYKKFPNETLRCLSRIDLTKYSKILDVGCGTGWYLHTLTDIGFKNLLGIDLYIEKNIKYKNGLCILKDTIHNINGEYDLIIFHHSFEHIRYPEETLQSVSRLLSKDGLCLIMIPTVSSYAWKHYGVHWVQLDAPRHFFLYSIESINILAEKTNFNLIEILYNSTDFQFWGSEQYLNDIPLKSERSDSLFSVPQIKAYKQKANQLNLTNQGDQAVFYLKKK